MPDAAPLVSRGDEAQAIKGTTIMHGLSRFALTIVVCVFSATIAIILAAWCTDFFGIGGGDDQTSPVDQREEQDAPNDEQDGDPMDEKTTTGSGLENTERPSLEALDGTQIADGDLIKREGSEELYVVKILRDQ